MIKKISFSLTIFIVLSCVASHKTSASLNQKRVASHKVKNPIILEPLKKYIRDEVNDNALLDVVLLRINEVDENTYDIYIKSDNFETYGIHAAMENGKLNPIGLYRLEGCLILLYGKVDVFFEKLSDPQVIFEQSKNDAVLVETHKSYKHYRYRKEELFGETEEYMDFVGELDEIDEFDNTPR